MPVATVISANASRSLRAQLKPPGRVFVFFRVEKPDLPPCAEHLAAFKAENNVGPNDALHKVTVTFFS